MSKGRAEADRRVIERIKRSPSGAMPLDIAKAFLGNGVRCHESDALTMIGLGIASRLCRAGRIIPTHANRFVVKS